MTGLHLTRTEENVAEIDALAALLADHGGGRVGVEGVLADLPRRVRRTYAPHPRLLGRKVARALTWDATDRRDPNWWPQGISSSVRTSVTRDVLAVSWYAKNDHGSRVSFVDLASRRYQHVLLAEPTMTDGSPGLKPLKVHAGGIVWHGPYLHVAATGRGFFTCRLDDLLRVTDGSGLETHGHRYVLPVRFAYKARTDEGVEKLRYSFLTLDRSTEPPSLVAGEYGSAQQTRRLARIPTDPETGLLATDQDGYSRPAVDERGQVRMQGAAVAEGVYYLTASQGHWNPGTVYVGTPGEFRAVRWATPPGPEDLVWWPATDLLWSVTEHPRRRWIFAMRRGSFDSR
ncbi:hypothetical protein HNR19_000895 [Nocardioides thalensis]|uniref:Uncharacterized protein n=1 Tax=Nocardioides thalensis TaxID=1914755 RepID=A0A853BZ98_9ACTN|nr:hypothetical protein [Nocardioides thalensis]NYJ00197.1 hypothetical protein [Nocardioides thalensis]